MRPWRKMPQALSNQWGKDFTGGWLLGRMEFSSVHSVICNSLQPHGLQHTRPPFPSPTPGACSNSCPLNQWCHPTISSSVVPFSSCLQSFPAWVFFQWVSSSHEVAKVLEFQLQHQSFQWIFELISFRIDWLDLFEVQGSLPRVFSNTTVQKHQFFSTQLSL